MSFKRLFPFLVIASLLLSGAGCGGPSQASIDANTPVTLKIWRVFDDQSTFGPIMDAYRKIHPNVSFDYRTLREDEYQDTLIHAFATGEGPDILSLHNDWIGQYTDLIVPMPASVAIPYCTTTGTIKKETTCTTKTTPTISQRDLKNDFVDVVAHDVIRNYQANPNQAATPQIMGLPMALDTLALYYNRDLLNAAGIATPPTSWDEFQTDVKKLTLVDANGNIVQSGAAIGSSTNVERASDILSVLMMQNGTVMGDAYHAGFAAPLENGTYPATDALRFYTDFANPVKEVYTWNAAQPDSFEAFTSGKTAFFFGYAYDLPLIKARAPKLNLAITPLPQIAGGRTVNFANYWVESVAKSSKNQKWAWDFLQFATSAEQVQSYLDATQKPTARRALINAQVNSDTINVFAGEVLTADSWYLGNDASIVDTAFASMIDGALAGQPLQPLVDDAQSKLNQKY